MFDYVTHLLIATRKNVLDCQTKNQQRQKVRQDLKVLPGWWTLERIKSEDGPQTLENTWKR